MPELKTYDVFISHAWTYHADYDRVVEMLRNAPLLKWRNYSVPKHDPLAGGTARALEQQLLGQIRPVNVVLILSGMYAAHREWIQREIELAQGLGKPIVGIRPWGQQRVPQAVQDAAKEMVGWNTASIVSAIRKHSL